MPDRMISTIKNFIWNSIKFANLSHTHLWTHSQYVRIELLAKNAVEKKNNQYLYSISDIQFSFQTY